MEEGSCLEEGPGKWVHSWRRTWFKRGLAGRLLLASRQTFKSEKSSSQLCTPGKGGKAWVEEEERGKFIGGKLSLGVKSNFSEIETANLSGKGL